jgi:hypothetical protein
MAMEKTTSSTNLSPPSMHRNDPKGTHYPKPKVQADYGTDRLLHQPVQIMASQRF